MPAALTWSKQNAIINLKSLAFIGDYYDESILLNIANDLYQVTGEYGDVFLAANLIYRNACNYGQSRNMPGQKCRGCLATFPWSCVSN